VAYDALLPCTDPASIPDFFHSLTSQVFSDWIKLSTNPLPLVNVKYPYPLALHLPHFQLDLKVTGFRPEEQKNLGII
jgi:hypothetical protein